MTPQDIFKRLEEKFGKEAIFDLHQDPKKDKDPWFQCAPYSFEEVGVFLRDDPEMLFDYMECLTGTDYVKEAQIRVTWHLYSYALKHRVVIKCFLPREDPAMPTMVNVWPVCNWQERECFDLLGVLFEGHPDLRRLLLPDDWEGHPMRKDYGEKGDYHGIPTTRPNPLELFKIGVPGKDGKVAPPEAATKGPPS
jgi:NADH-quinone oxidoreductase subunit C